MNLCVFTGRLTRDPELTYTPTGKAVVDFSIAVNEGKSSDGKELVTFVNCQAWDKTAESIAKFFKKGKPINVQARLKNEKWTDKTTGDGRRAERFVVDRFNFVPTETKHVEEPEETAETPEVPKKASTRKSRSTATAAPAPAPSGGFDPSTEEDDDIPF